MAEQSKEPQWFKSSYSASPDNECVEVANMPKRTLVRDSKRPAGPHTGFSHSAWATFTVHVGSGTPPLLG
ncbi:DUF397 domain-containing protein [Streptomyces finlayi]|uniref:DUF397 domain-containing protein n=1 Tax=Streptomyces finlayi TaxID=67296 RepID=A0A7G7BPR9_9ACTN|nr:DUF397 domain-containing protein [Streptomyces finlayi]QNE77334.1 DUF397 domain-containing protein [Streptomyces finlayi]